MEQLLRANLQIIELLGAVFEEVERQGLRTSRGQARPARLRAWIGKPPRAQDTPMSRMNAMN